MRLYGEDAGVVCGSHDAEALWQLGYPDQAWARSQGAVRLAQQMAHPLSLAYALGMAAVFHQLRREWQTCQERAEATILLAQAQGFPSWIAVGSILRGWALVQQGQAQEGMAQITHALMTYRATGAEIARPYYLRSSLRHVALWDSQRQD